MDIFLYSTVEELFNFTLKFTSWFPRLQSWPQTHRDDLMRSVKSAARQYDCIKNSRVVEQAAMVSEVDQFRSEHVLGLLLP